MSILLFLRFRYSMHGNADLLDKYKKSKQVFIGRNGIIYAGIAVGVAHRVRCPVLIVR